MLASPLESQAAVSKRQVIDYLTGFSIESTPKSIDKVGDFRRHLRPGTRVMVTHLPGAEFSDTIVACRRLKEQGFLPVPHVAARNIPDEATLATHLDRLQRDVGVDEALVLGGGRSKPLGRLHCAMQILDSGLLEAHGIRRIGVAGHPEGSPDISDEELRRALHRKNEHAARTGSQLYLITQFCFEATPVIAWDLWLRAEGNQLPVFVGIPGLATVKTLIGHARACGVGASIRVLMRSSGNLTRLMAERTPGRLIGDLAAHVVFNPATSIRGAHLFPFGGLSKTSKWTYAVLDGAFEMEPGGNGITVTAPPE